MLLRVVEKFRDIEDLPIEIEDIREAILSLGFQDRIIFCADQEMVVSRLRGVFYQYRQRPVLYGEPEDVTLIVYASSEPLAWQRTICCKEMIHIFDDKVERTETLEELDGLIKRLLGPLSVDEVSIYDLMAAKDRLALYQAIPLLFPMAARNRALAEVKSGTKAVEQIAEEACLPLELVQLALSEDWPRLAEYLCSYSVV
jgi:hypothetical protein